MATMRNLRSSVMDNNNQELLQRPGKGGALETGRSALGNLDNVLGQRGRTAPGDKPGAERAPHRKPERSRGKSKEEDLAPVLPPSSVVLPMDLGLETGFSALPVVEDIDRDDLDDPQMVTEVVEDVYAYLRVLERKQEIKHNYLLGPGIAITPKMRSVLIDWLLDVHQQFKLLQETLYMTVYIIDRYLQSLQLIGVTAMFIASKYEEMYAPEIRDFVFITDSTYTEAQIRSMERKMMGAIQFELGRPLPLHFLRRYSKAGFVNAKIHTLAKFIMELSLVEYKLAHIYPSMLAAGALAYSMRVLEEDKSLTLEEMWTPTLVHYSTYAIDDILPLVKELAKLVQKTVNAPKDAKLMQVRKKYAGRKYFGISQHALLKSTVALNLSEEE
ncbi:Cyclin B1 [Caligus rogercresseyi]|uniref:Cyclin B1 n=1 Tax=Caligus rogercresseyi TaxID=217165 RepID=A0A7T8JXG8_CALRO|nr:Cyclin B1 [Caligus rogercresseyi]